MTCGCPSAPSCGCYVSAPVDDGCHVSPPRVSHQRLRERTPAPIYRRKVNRLPTPAPDVIERVCFNKTK